MAGSIDAFLEQKIATCERAWHAGSFPALMDVIALCKRYSRPLPQWAADGALKALAERYEGAGGEKRGCLASLKNEHRQRYIHYSRWDAVRELRDRRRELADRCEPTWDAVYENASKVLQGTVAAGGPDAVKKSYKRVAQAFREGRGAEYHMAAFDTPPSKWGKKTC